MTALAVAFILVRTREAGAVPLRGEEELTAQTATWLWVAKQPGAAGTTDTHGSLHGTYMMMACPLGPE